jgi:hypothetical protein
MILDLFILTAIIVFVVDVSGIIESAEWWLSKWISKPCKIPKPFSCSLCMTFWLGLIWILIYGFTLPHLLTVCVFAALSEQVYNMFMIIKHLIDKVQVGIQLWIDNN